MYVIVPLKLSHKYNMQEGYIPNNPLQSSVSAWYTLASLATYDDQIQLYRLALLRLSSYVKLKFSTTNVWGRCPLLSTTIFASEGDLQFRSKQWKRLHTIELYISSRHRKIMYCLFPFLSNITPPFFLHLHINTQ